MNGNLADFLIDYSHLTRRYFLRCGTAGVAAMASQPLLAGSSERDPRLQMAIDKLETWLTADVDFRDVSRGTPKPHSLPEDKKKEVGLTRDTWKLEIASDPNNSIGQHDDGN